MSRSPSFSDFIAASCSENTQLQTLLIKMCGAAIKISHQLNTSVFPKMPVSNDEFNVQGERQHYMDVFAEQQFMRYLKESCVCSMLISEEQPEIIRFDSEAGTMARPYIVALDPLDGSSNVEVNVPVGSIFSVYKRIEPAEPVNREEVFRSGKEQIAAGYFLYGTSTILIFAYGNEVNGFTLNKGSHEFILSHPQIRIPEDGAIYAVNDANYPNFAPGPQNFLRYCRQQAAFGDQPFTARYSGSMVSDIHRILISGGIFLYPGTIKSPQGKLRLAYECFPIAFILESAGGLATNGYRRLLDLTLESVHQRSPIIAGSANLVIKADRFINTSIPPLYELKRQT